MRSYIYIKYNKVNNLCMVHFFIGTQKGARSGTQKISTTLIAGARNHHCRRPEKQLNKLEGFCYCTLE